MTQGQLLTIEMSKLWKSDTGGTAMVKDIFPTGAYTSDPRELTDVDGTLYFVADDGTRGYSLWRSDGTVGGTDIVPNAGSQPGQLTASGGALYYVADDGVHGSENGRPGDALVKLAGASDERSPAAAPPVQTPVAGGRRDAANPVHPSSSIHHSLERKKLFRRAGLLLLTLSTSSPSH